MKLDQRFVEKPWGRTRLPPGFEAPNDRKIGEVWFTSGADLPLLAKYIFTSERLSIQVHPDDQQARARGLPRGKNECWYILDADPGASLGLGLTRPISRDELRAAALDGSIDHLLAWRNVAPGDFFFVPAGTIHALGGGLSLLELQQNADITYRFYDYGSARDLHVDDAVAVADPGPYPAHLSQHLAGDEGRVLVDGPQFRLALATADRWQDCRRWVLPLEGEVRSGSDVAAPGECLLLEPGATLEAERARMLIGATA